MGGFAGALRFRPKEHVGIDLGSGYFAGNDYQGFYRSEIPLTANVLFFVNPQHKLQLYFLIGPGVSFGRVETFNEVRRMTHVGGQAGAGPQMSDDERATRRAQFQNMSDEERATRRAQFSQSGAGGGRPAHLDLTSIMFQVEVAVTIF